MTAFPFRRLVAASAVIGAGAATSFGCLRATASADGTLLPGSVRVAGPSAPKLVVFITVDQLRADYPSRFPGELKHGIARLTNGGAWFTFGFQDHAITETAPGHASIMSGRFPSHTGIASNSIGVIDPKYKLLGGLPSEVGASPERFRGTTLYDWLVAKDKRARALSVSLKDRGAILTIGRSKQDVYWYSNNGSFTTSNYYRDTLPTWVTEFNARRIPQSYAGAAWSLSRDTSTYKEKDAVSYENGGNDNVFPHRFPDNRAPGYMRATPTADSVAALLALEGLRSTGIGLGPQTDVMSVSFSATDYIGHTYGPDSREMHENMLRLDETIGWFVDSLYKQRDSASIVIALTGDHGMSPIPELARERGEATGDQGLRVSLRQQVAQVRAGLRAANADTEAFLYDGELIGVNRVALKKAGVNADSLLSAFTRAALQVHGVARVDRMTAIRQADFALDPIARRWAHQIPNDHAIDLVITLTRYSSWGPLVATHGSPYDQDASVPIIFYGAGVKPGRYITFARTVDMAPTLAMILRVKPLEKLDGRVLLEAIVR
jgi:predicted AlkP superfamily pyrophosphatase or phosphodiesterase